MIRTTPVVIRLECGHLGNASRQPLLPVTGSFRCGQCSETGKVTEDVTHHAVGNALTRFASAVAGIEATDRGDVTALVDEWIPEIFKALSYTGQRVRDLPVDWGSTSSQREPSPLSSKVGQCRQCKRNRTVFPAQKSGGGSYKRGGRWYKSRICNECAASLLHAANQSQRTVSQWSVSSLERVVDSSTVSEGSTVL